MNQSTRPAGRSDSGPHSLNRYRRFEYRVIYSAVRALQWGAARFSRRRSVGLGEFLGAWAFRLARRHRRRALENLAIAFPVSSAIQRKNLARESFLHLGRALGEILWMPRLTDGDLGGFVELSGAGHLANALAEGKGVILVTGHCGNWELMAAAIGRAGFPMNVVGRELRTPELNELALASRRHHGVQTIVRGSEHSARQLLTTLRQGKILGMLIDQDTAVESIFVDFFGRPAATPSGAAAFARKTGAPVVTGFTYRTGEGSHRVIFDPPWHVEDRGDRETEVRAATQRMTEAIESQIRSHPEQWVWMHPRWKTRPPAV